MSILTAIVLSAAASAAPAPAAATRAPRNPIVQERSATASVRVLRPEAIRFAQLAKREGGSIAKNSHRMQVRRSADGSVRVDFL